MSVIDPFLQHTIAVSVESFFDTTAKFLWARIPGVSVLPGDAPGPMNETFAQRLRRLRSEQGYTVVDLASAVGASEGTIRQLESGKVKAPNLLLGIRLAEQLKVEARYLALGEGPSIGERIDTIEQRLTKIEKRLATIPISRR